MVSVIVFGLSEEYSGGVVRRAIQQAVADHYPVAIEASYEDITVECVLLPCTLGAGYAVTGLS